MVMPATEQYAPVPVKVRPGLTTSAVQRPRLRSGPGPDWENHSQSPCLQKPDHGKQATIAASFGQRPSRELGNQQQVEEAIDGQCNTAGRARSTGQFGSHRI